MAFNQEERVKQEEEKLAALIEEQKKFEKQKESENGSEEGDETLSISKEEKPAQDLNQEDPEEDPDDTKGSVDWKKRHGDLRRHSQKVEASLKDEIESLKQEVSSLKAETNGSVLPASLEEVEEWKDQNPHAFALVETLATKIAEDKFNQSKAELEALKADLGETKRTTLQEANALKIKKAHPDFESLQEDDSFHDWVEAQPKMVQDAVYETFDPDQVIWAINIYKQTSGKPKRKTPNTAEEIPARDKPAIDFTGDKGVIKESDVANMTEKEFAEMAEEISKAQRSGKFVYDLSAAAR